MKKIAILLFLFIVFFAKAQIDAIKIANAQKAYEDKDYKTAIEELNQVTQISKEGKLYLYYMGNSFYKLQKLDSAKKYLKKYLIMDPSDTKIFEIVTVTENRLKWFAEKPSRQETINWLKSKIDNFQCVDAWHPEIYYKYKFIENYIMEECYDKTGLWYNKKLYFNDIYEIKKRDDDTFTINTDGKKIIEYDYHVNETDKTNVFSLSFDKEVESGLSNKIYKALSNLALENIKNMPAETY